MAINLVPIELAPKGSAVKISAQLKTAVIILATILLLFSLGVVAFFIINLIELRSLTQTTDTLKEKISVLETTEQKYFLVKDRLKHAKEITQDPTAQEKHQKIANLFAAAPTDVLLTQADVGRDRINISITTTNSSSLVTFMSLIVSSTDFAKINLEDFSYTPTEGYEATFNFY